MAITIRQPHTGDPRGILTVAAAGVAALALAAGAVVVVQQLGDETTVGTTGSVAQLEAETLQYWETFGAVAATAAPATASTGTLDPSVFASFPAYAQLTGPTTVDPEAYASYPSYAHVTEPAAGVKPANAR